MRADKIFLTAPETKHKGWAYYHETCLYIVATQTLTVSFAD